LFAGTSKPLDKTSRAERDDDEDEEKDKTSREERDDEEEENEEKEMVVDPAEEGSGESEPTGEEDILGKTDSTKESELPEAEDSSSSHVAASLPDEKVSYSTLQAP